MAKKQENVAATAESLGQRQREISVSEFFLKNRHLLGFDNPRKALMTAVKEAVDNSLDACEEAEILPEIGVEITQTAATRFKVAITDNGPGIVRAQIPKIFAKLLYGSKFHRLRMARGQQGIGISAAGMYSQLTTGGATHILSRTQHGKTAHLIDVQIDTRKNAPTILKDEEIDWKPEFLPTEADGTAGKPVVYGHGTCVSMEMEAAYVRGRLSVDQYLQQCAVVNPHLELHYRMNLLKKEDKDGKESAEKAPAEGETAAPASFSVTYRRVTKEVPAQPREIKPHPHGVELGMLMQMLKDTKARTLRSALTEDFSRISSATALEICVKAGLSPKGYPCRIAAKESEALFKAIAETKLMRPPTDCLVPIGEDNLIAGLKKEVVGDFYTAVSRPPTVYRGNPFTIEAALAYTGKPGEQFESEEPVRLMRFANRVPLLYMAGACAINKAVAGMNWKNYGVSQPRGSLPIAPMVIAVHMASVWVPFTSESKEAIAHYPEIIGEITLAVQECGRQLAAYLSRKRRNEEAERKRNYMVMYIPHLALGLKEVLKLDDKQEKQIINKLEKMLEKTHLET